MSCAGRLLVRPAAQGHGDGGLPLVMADGKKAPPPEVPLRTGQSVAYRAGAQTLADASKAGLSKVGFVSEPERL